MNVANQIHNIMCGGAIISDLIAAKRGRRNLTTQDLWSQLDADLLNFPHSDYSPKPNGPPQLGKYLITVSRFRDRIFLGTSLRVRPIKT